MRRLLATVLAIASAALASDRLAAADALPDLQGSLEGDRTRYRGPHPLPGSHPGRFCYIEPTHTHSFAPAAEDRDDFLVRQGGELEYAGDSGQHGYEGMQVAFFGPHPLDPEGQDDAMCSSTDEHLHLRSPAPLEAYEHREGTYYFGSVKIARRQARKLRRATRRQAHARRRPEPRRARPPAAVGDDRARAPERAETVASESFSWPQEKTRRQSFRSWMDRRRGR